jgi:biopolymer transport protein TolR
VEIGDCHHFSFLMPALRRRGPMHEINIVPYVDVMLVLLVIFMVTAPLITPAVIDLPTVEKAGQPRVVPLEVYIGSATGSLVLYAGAAPGAVSGLIQINARVPADAVTSPSAPVVVVINRDYTDALYGQRVTTIAVR